jgi:hypothetical protein
MHTQQHRTNWFSIQDHQSVVRFYPNETRHLVFQNQTVLYDDQ